MVHNSAKEQLVMETGRRKRLKAEYVMSKSPHSDKVTETVQRTIHKYETSKGMKSHSHLHEDRADWVFKSSSRSDLDRQKNKYLTSIPQPTLYRPLYS